ncbi:MAG: hypothetical protein ABSG15_14810, partial [FCB group bacterium]
MNALVILIFASSLLYTFQVFSIGSYGVTTLDVLLGILILVFIKKIVWDGEKLKAGLHLGLFFYFGLFIAALLSGITPLQNGSMMMILQYFKSTIHFIFFGFFVFICAFYPFKEGLWTKVIKTFLIISIFINLFGIYQIVARAYDLPLAWLPITNISYVAKSDTDVSSINQLSLQFGNFFRATSIFSEPSTLAIFTSMNLIFIIVPFVQNLKPFLKSKNLNIAVFITNIAGLFLTFSLTGYIILALVIIGIIVLERTKRIISFIYITIISI